jgi:hypothetical protein
MCIVYHIHRCWRCAALFALVMSCGLAGCGEKPQAITQGATGDDWFKTGNGGDFEVRHRLRTSSVEGWKAEVWLWGSTFTTSSEVDVNVRLTPENQELKAMPIIALHLAISKKREKMAVRQASPKADWQECAKMKKHREKTFEDGKWGKTVDFPPKGSCWEATITDAFKSDRRLPGTTLFEAGDYVLEITIEIDGGPKFHFENIEIEMLKGYDVPK